MADSPDGIRLTDAQRLDWLRLIRSENVGPRTFHALLRHCGTARAALEALPDLARRGAPRGRDTSVRNQEAAQEIEAAGAAGVVLLGFLRARIPRTALKAIADPPPLLAVRGPSAGVGCGRW